MPALPDYEAWSICLPVWTSSALQSFRHWATAPYGLTVSLLRQLCVLLPVAYLFAKIGGLTWIWWSLPLAECVALIICLLFMLRIYRKVIRHVPDNP